MKLRLLGAVCICAFASGILTSANAALVTGSISLSGGFTPVNSSASPQPASLGAATGLSFDGNAIPETTIQRI